MTANGTVPSISVVVPMYNAERHIERCLAPLLAMLSVGELSEIIVVSDCATDRSESLVSQYPQVRLMRTARQSGPGAARNLGAKAARGDFLWFVDSDVVLADNAARVLCDALAQGSPAAVIGSYDDSPDAMNFLSQYKNLVHHFYHQRGRRRASTFWTGCGAVRRQLFVELGGFDAVAHPNPSMEDIELGYRILDAGENITLEPGLQGKHLKEWRLANLLHTEIFGRALPWSRLMLSRRGFTNDLNVSQGERARASLAVLTLVLLVTWLTGPVPGWAPLSLLAVSLVASWPLVQFLRRKRGAWFALRAFLLHQVYYLYSTASFAVACIQGSQTGGR